MGFMGSGKTSLGKKLAPKLSLEFIDLDKFIEDQEAESIVDIFSLHGEGYFRKKEKKILNLLLKKNNIVIAAGGGTPCFFDNMMLIKEKAVSIYLKVTLAELYKRLSVSKLLKQRPLLQNLTSRELKQFIKKTLQLREKFYFQANHVIRVGEKKPKELVREIAMKVKNSK